MLDLLAKYNVRATFFLIGQFAVTQRDLVRRIYDAGHLIGNHTWTHPNLFRTDQPDDPQRAGRDHQPNSSRSLARSVRFLPAAVRHAPHLRLLIARELGLIPVTWNVIGNDWNAPSAEAIVDRVTRLTDKNHLCGQATNLVLHDGGHRALDADRAFPHRQPRPVSNSWHRYTQNGNS